MNFYKFIKRIQEGIGNCEVAITIYDEFGMVGGLEINIKWKYDFWYRFIVLEQHIENDGFLEHFSEYIIKDASRKFSIAEVGED